MATFLGLDYAGGVPQPTAIVNAGYGFVCRYLTPGGAGLPGKLLTPSEFTALQAAGIAVVLNFETTADRMRAGHDAGIADAQVAHATANSLGIPADRAVYFSADFDATPVDQVAIDAYLTGAASVIGAARVGVYGSYYAVQRCLDNGTAHWAWQTSAWSGGLIEPRAHIYQHGGTVLVGGVECDINEALQVDFGQHPYSSPLGVPDMPAGVIASGPQTTKLVMPIGPSVSALVAKGWLSLASSEDGTAQVWIQGPKGGIGPMNDITLVKDQRWWMELPDGTDQMTLHTNSTGSVGWCLELQSR